MTNKSIPEVVLIEVLTFNRKLTVWDFIIFNFDKVVLFKYINIDKNVFKHIKS